MSLRRFVTRMVAPVAVVLVMLMAPVTSFAAGSVEPARRCCCPPQRPCTCPEHDEHPGSNAVMKSCGNSAARLPVQHATATLPARIVSTVLVPFATTIVHVEHAPSDEPTYEPTRPPF